MHGRTPREEGGAGSNPVGSTECFIFVLDIGKVEHEEIEDHCVNNVGSSDFGTHLEQLSLRYWSRHRQVSELGVSALVHD